MNSSRSRRKSARRARGPRRRRARSGRTRATRARTRRPTRSAWRLADAARAVRLRHAHVRRQVAHVRRVVLEPHDAIVPVHLDVAVEARDRVDPGLEHADERAVVERGGEVGARRGGPSRAARRRARRAARASRTCRGSRRRAAAGSAASRAASTSPTCSRIRRSSGVAPGRGGRHSGRTHARRAVDDQGVRAEHLVDAREPDRAERRDERARLDEGREREAACSRPARRGPCAPGPRSRVGLRERDAHRLLDQHVLAGAKRGDGRAARGSRRGSPRARRRSRRSANSSAGSVTGERDVRRRARRCRRPPGRIARGDGPRTSSPSCRRLGRWRICPASPQPTIPSRRRLTRPA